MGQVHLWESHWKGTLLQQGWTPIYTSMATLISPQLTSSLGQLTDQKRLIPCMLHLKTFTLNFGVRPCYYLCLQLLNRCHWKSMILFLAGMVVLNDLALDHHDGKVYAQVSSSVDVDLQLLFIATC